MQILKKLQLYDIIYTEILAKQVFGRCPFVLCTNCVIDGYVKMLLQASIFTYGIIFYEINSSGNINAEKRTNWCGFYNYMSCRRYLHCWLWDPTVHISVLRWLRSRILTQHFLYKRRGFAFSKKGLCFPWKTKPWNFIKNCL